MVAHIKPLYQNDEITKAGLGSAHIGSHLKLKFETVFAISLSNYVKI